jgi:membrane protein required for colicin V production
MNQVAMHAFNLADYFILAVILFSTLISLMRGFISEAISLLTWIIAAVIAFKSAIRVGNLLINFIHSPSLRLIIAFVFVLIIILIIGSIINHFLGAVIRSSGLSGTNRLLGMIFGFARGVLLIAILILFARMTSVAKEPWWITSQLIPYFQGLTNWLQQIIPLQFNNMSHFFKPKPGT